MPHPKTIGGSCDRLKKLRDVRLEKARAVDALKKDEAELTAHIIKLLSAQKLASGSGKLATATITRKTIGAVEDWPKYFKWMAAEGAFDMVQQRVAMRALADRLEEGESCPPGLRLEKVIGLSLTAKRSA